MKAAILGLRNNTRNNKKKLINATRTIENEGTKGPKEKDQLRTKRGKRMRGKQSGHKITWTVHQANNG